MGWTRLGGPWRVGLLGLALLFGPGAAGGGEAQAARGRKESMPGPRGPKVPTRLPASSRAPLEAHPELRRLPASPAGGRYANSLEALAPAAARRERSAQASYSYCLRTVTTYEYVYYGASGRLRHGYARAVQHGTGFAYRLLEGEFLVATNHHVAHLPEVTSAARGLDGVPAGARKVRESVFIVGDEDDDHAAGFVLLTPVYSDAVKDLAILKTAHRLNPMPYRFGSSAALQVGNTVLARGYPLGVMPALNVGRVTNARHLDTDGDWNHLDFITDAALNNGNSGSPVFAISARTGEPELVGIFHAHYRSATGMGVVIGIDEIRAELEGLRPPAPLAEPRDERLEGRALLGLAGKPVYFPFAGLTARAVMLDSGTRFEVYEDFPESEQLQLLLMSREAGPRLQLPGRIGAGEPAALREPVERLDRELWASLATALRLRRELAGDDGSAGARRRIATLRKRLSAGLDEQKELLSVVDFESRGFEAEPAGGPVEDG